MEHNMVKNPREPVGFFTSVAENLKMRETIENKSS